MSSRILTMPNILSFFRLALVPVFLVFIIIGDDCAGPARARRSPASPTSSTATSPASLNQVSRLGQLLDPAADRLFIFAALIGLAWRDILPWWLVAVILARDVMLAILGIILANHGYGPLPVHHLGKVATFSLFVALPILMLGVAFHAIAPISFRSDGRSPSGVHSCTGGLESSIFGETRRVIRIPAGRVGRRPSDTLDG